VLSARPESPRAFCIIAGIFLALVTVSRSAAGQNPPQGQDPQTDQSSKPEYGKQSPAKFVVRVYHGLTLQAISYQVASGNRLAEPPQPWVMKQGSQVCLQVVNAHSLKYTYAVGQILDTTPPPDLKLPELAGTIASAFGGSAVKAMSLRGAGRSRAPRVSSESLPPTPSIAWLETYAKKVQDLSNKLDEVKDLAKNSDNPEDLAHAEELVSQRGLRWAKQQIGAVPTGKGDLGSPTLEQTLSGWESDARRDADAARDAAKLEGTSKTDWDNWTDEVITSLAAAASATRADWITIRDAYAKASPTWMRCVTLGSHPIQVTLSVKASATGTVRATGTSLLSINVDPYYEWKRLEAAPLAFAVYAPGAETLTLVDGRVGRKDASLRVRAGTVLLTNLSAFGAREEQSISLVLGVGLLDASSTTAGKADLLIGFAYRLQDVLGMGLAFSLSERNRRRDQVQIGQPLPAGITTIEAASEESWRPGIALGISLKGYKF
jgi:hypothetical protein